MQTTKIITFSPKKQNLKNDIKSLDIQNRKTEKKMQNPNIGIKKHPTNNNNNNNNSHFLSNKLQNPDKIHIKHKHTTCEAKN